MELEENIKNEAEITFKNNQNIIEKLINLIINNNMSFDTHFPFNIEKSYKELCFLNNKRKFPNSNLENENENLTDLKENEKYKKKFHLIEKLKNFIKNNDKTEIKIKDNINIICKKLNVKNFSSDINNLYKIENNNSIQINKSALNQNQLNISKINKNNNSKENNLTNDINKISNFSEGIRIRKNNKMVFINKSLIKPKKKNKEIKEKKRRSRYRGVSKNGNKWQAIMFYNKNKGYIGLYSTEEIAARVYDIYSIKNKGIKAKTNFPYNIHQIKVIIETNIDFKSKNIESIISNLIKN